MALQIWLPLNSNLDNQGLAETTVTVTGTTSFVAGKIGQGLSCNGSSFWTVSNINLGSSCSIACWTKTSTNNKMSWVLSSDASNKLNLYQSSIYTLNTGDGNDNPYKTDNNSNITCLHDGLWHHFVVTFNSTVSKLYIDGAYAGTAATFRNPTTTNGVIKIGGGYNGTHTYDWNGMINDFRVYDHCLSPKEVKEISKGLVLHYPLNNGGFGQENLATNTAFPNSNVQGYCGQKAILYNHSDWTSGGRFFVGDSNSHLTFTEIQANQPYTISAWVYIYDDVVVSHPGGTSIFYRVYKTTGTSPTYSYDIAVTLDNITERNKWIKISNTFISPYTYTYNQGGSFSIGGYNGHFLVSMPKVELGSIATPWCPNSSDALADKLGLNNGIEYDVSGYQNNGSIIGALTYSSDTPRYMVSTYFNGGDNAITVPFNSVISDATIPFTINLWFKKSELGTDNYESLFGGPSGFEMDTRSGNATSLSLYMTSTHGGAVYSPFNLNEWYMVTMASDRTNEYYYVNGELSKTITAKSMPVGNYFIGAWQVYNKQNYKGLISDFRIYSTCLSADDILALYNTPASIANNGTLMTQGEISEV